MLASNKPSYRARSLFALLCAFGASACQPVKLHHEPEPTPPPITTPSTRVSPPVIPTMPPPSAGDTDLVDDDLTHVDPQAITPQARAVALRQDAHAVLIYISTSGTLDQGTLNLLGDGSVIYEFEFLYFDKSQPPGRDKREGTIWVTARQDRLLMRRSLSIAADLHGSLRSDPAPDPHCSLRKAWQTAVSLGVPANAVVEARYAAAWPRGPGKPFVWSFQVDGHREFDREIDDRSCGLAGPAVAVPAHPRKTASQPLPVTNARPGGAPSEIY